MIPTRTYMLLACLSGALGAALMTAGTQAIALHRNLTAARLAAASAAFEGEVAGRLQSVATLRARLKNREAGYTYHRTQCTTMGLWCNVIPLN